MSTKTMKQRIALVAVSALTAGLFSVIATPAAKAAEAAAGDSGVILVSGSICLATNAAGGAPLTAANTGGAEADASPFESGSAAGRILTVPVGGSLKVAYDAADIITMSGPLSVTNLTGQGLAVTTNATITTTNGKTIINGNAADSDVTITALSVGTGVLTVSTATADPAVTDANTIYINVVAACTNTTYSASKSTVYVKGSDGTTVDGATNVDTTTSASSGSSLFINITGKNAYSVAMTTGTYSVSATNGALVNITQNQVVAPVKGTTSAITGTPDGTDMVRVDPASALVTSTTVVTITHNGTAVATKTLTFFGEAASIDVLATNSGNTGTAGAGADTGFITYQYKDTAGNVVPGAAVTGDPTTYTRTVTAIGTGQAPRSSAGAVTSDLLAAVETAIGNTAYGIAPFSCGSTSGSSTLTIQHTNAISAATITKAVPLTCAGGVATYTVSLDKASYALGEIAEITITAKDSSGNAVSDVTGMGANNLVSVGGGSLTVTSAAADAFSKGVRKYKAQMTTAGTFNTVVSIAGSVTTSATASYKVTDGAVSNAEVLKSIVALIASINKQIAALQKLILRR